MSRSIKTTSSRSIPRRSNRSLEELYSAYRSRSSVIRSRLKEFQLVQPEEYFFELAYCLLTPQSSAAAAEQAIGTLKRRDFRNRKIDPTPLLRGDGYYIRFHNTKARRLQELKSSYALVHRQVLNGSASEELRDWLVANVRGLGYKEASHFLRNIGHRNLAILDRHILRNLVAYRVIPSIPKTLARKTYIEIEQKVRAFADRIGIDTDELDLLFWSMETGEVRK